VSLSAEGKCSQFVVVEVTNNYAITRAYSILCCTTFDSCKTIARVLIEIRLPQCDRCSGSMLEIDGAAIGCTNWVFLIDKVADEKE
jgi:hypothetical protein